MTTDNKTLNTHYAAKVGRRCKCGGTEQGAALEAGARVAEKLGHPDVAENLRKMKPDVETKPGG